MFFAKNCHSKRGAGSLPRLLRSGAGALFQRPLRLWKNGGGRRPAGGEARPAPERRARGFRPPRGGGCLGAPPHRRSPGHPGGGDSSGPVRSHPLPAGAAFCAAVPGHAAGVSDGLSVHRAHYRSGSPGPAAGPGKHPPAVFERGGPRHRRGDRRHRPGIHRLPPGGGHHRPVHEGGRVLLSGHRGPGLPPGVFLFRDGHLPAL